MVFIKDSFLEGRISLEVGISIENQLAKILSLGEMEVKGKISRWGDRSHGIARETWFLGWRNHPQVVDKIIFHLEVVFERDGASVKGSR